MESNCLVFSDSPKQALKNARFIFLISIREKEKNRQKMPEKKKHCNLMNNLVKLLFLAYCEFIFWVK